MHDAMVLLALMTTSGHWAAWPLSHALDCGCIARAVSGKQPAVRLRERQVPQENQEPLVVGVSCLGD